MTRLIQDLRIGTKLALASTLTIFLLAGMIYLQIAGATHVREAGEAASRQQSVAANAGEAKASVRGLQVGTRDMVLASNPGELQTALEYFATRKASAMKFIDELAKLSASAENRERIARLKVQTDAFDKAKDQLVAIRKQVFEVEAKRGKNDSSAEVTAQLSKLADEIVRVRSEVTIPISKEMEAIANAIAEHGNKRSVEARARASEAEASFERTSLIAGLSVALLLIGTCVFSVFTIASDARTQRLDGKAG
jgi:CHASE3 domain sensor protein